MSQPLMFQEDQSEIFNSDRFACVPSFCWARSPARHAKQWQKDTQDAVAAEKSGDY